MSSNSASPLLSALLEVGKCAEEQISSAKTELDESVRRSEQETRTIVEENFREFQRRTEEVRQWADGQFRASTEDAAAVRKSLQDSVRSSKESFLQHQETLDALQQNIETLRGELEEEKQQRQAGQAKLREDHESTATTLREEMQRKYVDMRDRHDNSNAKFTELIVEANEGMQSIVQKMENDTNQTQSRIDILEQSSGAALAESEAKVLAAVTSLSVETKDARDKIEESVRSECEALSADIDNACEDYSNLIAEVRRQLEIKYTEIEIEIVGAEQKNANAMSEAAAQLNAHDTQLKFLKESVKSTETDAAKRRDDLKAIVQGLVLTEKNEREKQSETVNAELASLKKQLDEIQGTLKDELHLTKQHTEQKLESIMSATQRNIMGLKENQQQQAAEIENAKSKLESRLETLRSTHESASQKLNSLAKKRNWVNDKEVDNCQCCDRRFGLTVRKHHCRMCGSVVCYSCSKWRRKIPGQTRLQRVCDTCIRNRSPSSAATGEFSRDDSARDRESMDQSNT